MCLHVHVLLSPRRNCILLVQLIASCAGVLLDGARLHAHALEADSLPPPRAHPAQQRCDSWRGAPANFLCLLVLWSYVDAHVTGDNVTGTIAFKRPQQNERGLVTTISYQVRVPPPSLCLVTVIHQCHVFMCTCAGDVSSCRGQRDRDAAAQLAPLGLHVSAHVARAIL